MNRGIVRFYISYFKFMFTDSIKNYQCRLVKPSLIEQQRNQAQLQLEANMRRAPINRRKIFANNEVDS